MATDNRLEGVKVFKANAALAGLATTLLDGIEKINAFNEQYPSKSAVSKAKADDPFGTMWKLIAEGKRWSKGETTDEMEFEEGQYDADALALAEAVDAASQALNEARENFANYVADTLGVERQKEAPKPDEEELKAMRKFRSEQLVDLANTMVNVSKFQSDPALTKELQDWLSSNPIPPVYRDSAPLDVTSESESAPKYRIDISVTDADGNVLAENERGITKAVQKVGKGGAPARVIREHYEAAGEKDTTFEWTVTEGPREGAVLTYVISKRNGN